MAGLLALVGCSPDPPGAAVQLSPLLVGESELRAADGTLVLAIDDVPGSIPVDSETEFGAGGRFVDASPGPGHDWLAVVTSGAAHSAGWLVELSSGAVHPSAFQYGGSLSLGPWSPDGRWVVFVHQGPAGDRTLGVAGPEQPGSTVREALLQVQVADHDARPPESREYEPTGWTDEGRLQFTIREERWTFDPGTGAVESG
jgi:hypothetical protein